MKPTLRIDSVMENRVPTGRFRFFISGRRVGRPKFIEACRTDWPHAYRALVSAIDGWSDDDWPQRKQG